jgi:hypothetical protein
MNYQDVREEQVQDRSFERKSIKQIFGTVRSFDKMKEQFVFYTPVTYYLIADQQHTEFSTDILSQILGGVIQEHPLVITELQQPVFRTEETLLLRSEHNPFLRTIYAVQTEIWQAAETQFRLLNLLDKNTRRFCVLRSHVETIPCPFGRHDNLSLDVHYFNCYGNKETYYFHTPETIRPASLDPDESFTPKPVLPILHYRAPIREIVELSERIFTAIEKTAPANTYKTYAEPIEACFQDKLSFEQRMAAIQKKNKLHEALAAKPLDESQLSVQARNECYELIKRYREVYGTESEERNS